MSNPPCKAHNKDGRPCKQFAQNGSDYCRAHDPNKPPRRSGAPKGNKNALRHGGYARRTQAPADWPDPDIRQLVTRLDVMRWGHAMTRPRPGFVWGEARQRLLNAQDRVLFAHSDLSGYSVFEEAHYRGVLAAERALAAPG